MADMTRESKLGGRRLHHALTAKRVQTVSAPGRYFDGHGLYLLVEPSGAKRWKQRLAVHGKRRELGLGGYPLVTLAMAREAALANRRAVHAGGDPLAEKRRARGVPTFAEAARKVFELRRDGWRNAKHAGQWITTLEQFVFPRFGARGVDEITTEDVIAVLSPIWHAKPTTAKRVRQRIGAVLTWAVAQGLRPDNPADAVKAVLPKPNGAGGNAHRALPYSEVADAIAAVRASSADTNTKLAFEFAVLTAARAGEVRLATWDEIDMDAATWTVPGERMKAGSEHRVPLSGRAVEVLGEAQALRSKRGDLVFRGRRGAMADSAIVHMLRRVGINTTAHGFRTSFRVWTQERTNIPREVCEAALAHTNPNKAEAAYARSDLFAKRRDLMERWARFLSSAPADVVSLDARRGAVR